MTKIVLTGILLLFVSIGAHAQFFAGVQGAYLSAEEYRNTGIGLQGKVMVNRNAALGLSYRYFPGKAGSNYGTNQYSAVSENRLSIISVTSEFYFGHSVSDPYVGPYVGVDAGFFNNRIITRTTGPNFNVKVEHDRPYAGLAPKLGLMIRPASLVSFFAQVQYNFAIGNRSPDEITIVNDASDTFVIKNQPLKNSWIFDVGALLTLGR